MPLGPHKLVALACMLGIAWIVAMPMISITINSNAVRSPPAIPAHVQAGDRQPSPVARHYSPESAP